MAGTTKSRPHQEADTRCRVGLNDCSPGSPPAQVDPLQSFALDPQSSPSGPEGKGIQRTGRTASSHFEHVGVDHRR
jgi:hypothetical protein